MLPSLSSSYPPPPPLQRSRKNPYSPISFFPSSPTLYPFWPQFTFFTSCSPSYSFFSLSYPLYPPFNPLITLSSPLFYPLLPLPFFFFSPLRHHQPWRYSCISNLAYPLIKQSPPPCIPPTQFQILDLLCVSSLCYICLCTYCHFYLVRFS
jgi:hypothetical protein